jgi:hypothetical protein
MSPDHRCRRGGPTTHQAGSSARDLDDYARVRDEQRILQEAHGLIPCAPIAAERGVIVHVQGRGLVLVGTHVDDGSRFAVPRVRHIGVIDEAPVAVVVGSHVRWDGGVVARIDAGRARAEAIVAGRLVDEERIGVNVADAAQPSPMLL